MGQSQLQRGGAPGPAALKRRFSVSAPRDWRGSTTRSALGTGLDEPNGCGSSGVSESIGSQARQPRLCGGAWRIQCAGGAALVVVRRQRYCAWDCPCDAARAAAAQWAAAMLETSSCAIAAGLFLPQSEQPNRRRKPVALRAGWDARWPSGDCSERVSVQQTEMRNRVRIIRYAAVNQARAWPALYKAKCRGKSAWGVRKGDE
jgi:hypothetical protein